MLNVRTIYRLQEVQSLNDRPGQTSRTLVQGSRAQCAAQWQPLRQSLADVIDEALDSYWSTMRGPEPDAILLASQAEVCSVQRRSG